MTDADRGFVFDGGMFTLEIPDALADRPPNGYSAPLDIRPVQERGQSAHHPSPRVSQAQVENSGARSLPLLRETGPRAFAAHGTVRPRHAAQGSQVGCDGQPNVANAVKAPQAHKKVVKPLISTEVKALLSVLRSLSSLLD